MTIGVVSVGVEGDYRGSVSGGYRVTIGVVSVGGTG